MAAGRTVLELDAHTGERCAEWPLDDEVDPSAVAFDIPNRRVVFPDFDSDVPSVRIDEISAELVPTVGS